MSEDKLKELLRTRPDRSLYHREGQELEFKEQFNLAGLAEYLRDFAAFANNRGGWIVFGVKDVPRRLVGLSQRSAEQFDSVDPEKISGFILDIFSSSITWSQVTTDISNRKFAAFVVQESSSKPVITRKDEGRDNALRNGDVYYRYGGRTQRIQSAELESIINSRIEKNNSQWMDLMGKIGKSGPENAAILDTEQSTIEKGEARIFVIDDDLADKLKFIKEGQFVERSGAPTLKLVGDVSPVTQVEVVRRVREDLLKRYPLSATELWEAVKKKYPDAKQNDVWRVLRDNSVKGDPNYSAYNFRNKRQEEQFKETGHPGTNPVIYNDAAVDLIVKILKGECKKGD